VNIAEAYAVCERLARSHYENFPVASRLLPRRMRPAISAIYAFARVADDFADEGAARRSDRIARLDHWHARLHASLVPGGSGRITGTVPLSNVTPGTDEARAIFMALSHTIRAYALPVSLFDDLLSAFRQDVTTNRYETWGDLLDYCQRSANPVGRLVLRVAGYTDDGLDAASDALCTALQLTNFWQDLERDWHIGRLYVPVEDLRAGGVDPDDLDRRRFAPGWPRVLSVMAARTRDLFDEGRPVCDGVTGRLRYELRLTWLGGRRILDALEGSGFDVFAYRPKLRRSDAPALLWGALTWKRAPGGRAVRP